MELCICTSSNIFKYTTHFLQYMVDKNQTSNIRGPGAFVKFLPSSARKKKKRKDQLKKKERSVRLQAELCWVWAGPGAGRLCDYFGMPQSCGCTAKLLWETWHNPSALQLLPATQPSAFPSNTPTAKQLQISGLWPQLIRDSLFPVAVNLEAPLSFFTGYHFMIIYPKGISLGIAFIQCQSFCQTGMFLKHCHIVSHCT